MLSVWIMVVFLSGEGVGVADFKFYATRKECQSALIKLDNYVDPPQGAKIRCVQYKRRGDKHANPEPLN